VLTSRPLHRQPYLRLLRLLRCLRVLRARRLIGRLTRHRTWSIHSGVVAFWTFAFQAAVVAHFLACLFFLWCGAKRGRRCHSPSAPMLVDMENPYKDRK
jgi:hypothetical protein